MTWWSPSPLSCSEEGRTPDCGSGRLMRLFKAKLLSVEGAASPAGRTHPWTAETTLTVRVVHFLLL